MDPALTDSNYTWDYSLLTSTSQTIDTFVSVSFANIGLYWLYFGSSSFALKSNSQPVSLGGVLSIDYEFDFFKKTSTSYVQTGFGAKMNGFPVPVPFTPKDTVYRLPLNYQDVGSSPSAFAVTVPSLGYYGGNKIRTDTADGWGTLITPYGTFSALRVKSVIDEIDSIHIDTIFHIGFNLPRPQVIEYKWLGVGMGMPLLQINTSGGIVTQILYQDSLRGNGPTFINSTNEEEAQCSIFPNPSSGKIVVELNLLKPGLVSFELLNLQGQRIDSGSFGSKPAGKNFAWIELADKSISAGTYLVKINVDGKFFQKQLVIER